MTVTDRAPESQDSPQDAPEKADRTSRNDARTGRSAAAARMQHQTSWVDQQIRVAMAKGEFDDLPGAGKPLKNLGTQDKDWWLRQLIEREQITGVLPPSLSLRKEDAELDERLDRLAVEREVRGEVEDFNARVLHARYTPQDGQPPLVTMPRDVDATVAQWRARRTARAAANRAALAAEPAPEPRRRWWSRRSRGSR